MGRNLFFAAICAAILVTAAPAGAVVYVEGTGEPAFTNTTTNTQWVKWQGSSAYEQYRLEFDMYASSALVKTEVTGNVSPNGSGTLWVDWAGVVNTLQEGTTYTICGYGRYWIGGIPSRDTGSCYDADQTGKRASTTIDRTKPAITVSIDSGAAFSKTANLHYRIDYADNLAFPFPANFLCRDVGTAPAQACANQSVVYNEACSVPAGGMKKVTWFDCSENLAAANIADGPVTLCAVAADAAIPDNPVNADQSRSASQANLSDRQCDSITVDRTAPDVGIVTSTTNVFAGDLVTFSAAASDATSGASGAYAWTWGDNTAGGSGSTASHTFTAPGTYEVSMKTADAAGNEATAKKVITVAARPTEGGGTTPPPSGGGTTTPPPGGGGTTTPPADEDEGDGDLPGDEGDEPEAATLTVGGPLRIKVAAGARTLPVQLTSTGGGLAEIALVRGGRRHVESTAVLRQAGKVTHRLRMPKGLKAGTYALKITWMPQDSETTSTQTRVVRVVGATPRTRARAVASAASNGPEVSATGAPVGVPTGDRPAAPADREVDLPVG